MLTSQIREFLPSSGVAIHRQPTAMIAGNGVRFLPPVLPKNWGISLALPMAKRSLVAPMKKPFHVVRIPRIPPNITMFEKTWERKAYAVMSAVGIPAVALISSGAASPIPMIRRQ